MLDKIDVTLGGDRLDAVDDVGVRRHLDHFITNTADFGCERRLDRDADFLGNAFLLRVDADMEINYEVADEDAVRALRRDRSLRRLHGD